MLHQRFKLFFVVKFTFRERGRRTKRDLETKEEKKIRKQRENKRFLQLKTDSKLMLDRALDRFYAPTKRTLNGTLRTAANFIDSLEVND